MIRIGTVARLLSIDITTLRRYEKAGKIPKARRTPLGFRVYSEDDIERLKTIVSKIGENRARPA